MLIVEDGVILEEYDKFIKVEGVLPPKITEITGITDKLLRDEGVDEEIIAHDLKERLTENTLMIAHNTQFDLSFVYHLLKRHYPDAYDIIEKLVWLDTLTILKDRKDYPHKLIDAVEHFGLKEVNFHRAIDDTKALYEVTKKMKKERDDLTEYINIFGYNPKYPFRNDEKFPFIEYKSQPYHNCGKLGYDKILPRI